MIKGKRSANLFSSNLAHLRRTAGLTQQELAQRTQLKRNNITAYEAGFSEPSLAKLKLISSHFKVSVDAMINQDLGSGNRNSIITTSSESDDHLAIESFAESTREAQKVMDGIIAFRNLQRSDEMLNVTDQGSDQLLLLLDQMLENNWQLINAMRRQNN